MLTIVRTFPPLLIVFISLSSYLSAIQIDGFTANTNDRFANNSNFIAQNLDLSGVGISSDGK